MGLTQQILKGKASLWLKVCKQSFFLVALLLLILPSSQAIISESENYKVNFVVKPSFESESDSYKFTSLINPISGNQSGVYQGFLLIPELQGGAIRAGGGGAGLYETEEQRAEVERQLMELLCGKNVSFINRLFSKCKIPNNNVCDDGENFLIDSDCMITIEGLKEADFFKQMWFVRYMLLLSIFLLFRDSKRYPLIIGFLILLFVYNGAFLPVGAEVDRSCMDVNFMVNLGHCILPQQPIIGWLIGLSVLFLFVTYFRKADKTVRKKRRLLDNRKIFK